MPPALAPYTGKLSGARRRLKKINTSVVRINQRLEEVHYYCHVMPFITSTKWPPLFTGCVPMLCCIIVGIDSCTGS
jgi:hypothetical protein